MAHRRLQQDDGVTSLTWRALTPEDAPALAELINAAIAADGTGRPIAAASIVEQFSMPRFDAATDSVGAWADDALVAAGSTWTGSEPLDGHALVVTNGHVHPQHRGRGIGSALLERLEGRAQEIAHERFPALPVRLRAPGGTAGSATERLLEEHGYRPDNYFITMEVVLPAWLDPGAAARAVAPDAPGLAATREAHNDAFRDHRNFTPAPEDVWQHWMSGEENRHDLSRVVIENDRVLAYALVGEPQPGVAHIEILGTRREARGRGLARAVLLETLRAAQTAGMSVAELEVDSTSPTGADRLYTSAGFAPVRTISRYQRDLT